MKDWDMFTPEGNLEVQSIVDTALEQRLTWRETYALLETLSEVEGFEEATDTAVREMVYDRIAAPNYEESFWC
jgi:hypothetical protein